ncbi:hypothetical protein KI387_030518 [Taxus chinensis]|uniref:Uncharacterized protein n=1 Tax=Taxus chinensis TaxID=29808 RepID=A0AA38CBV6_TAXCH|nr:hypothetical protein KI387_030518 [Taxus chinensis]
MPPSGRANSSYGGPDLKGGELETFSRNVVGEPPFSHTGAECENWHENGEFEDSQIGAMEDSYEIQDEDDEPMFVLTDEWMEFFAKSEAARQQKKKQQQKEAKKLRKAERLASKKHDNEADIADSFVYGSEDGNTSAIL